MNQHSKDKIREEIKHVNRRLDLYGVKFRLNAAGRNDGVYIEKYDSTRTNGKDYGETLAFVDCMKAYYAWEKGFLGCLSIIPNRLEQRCSLQQITDDILLFSEGKVEVGSLTYTKANAFSFVQSIGERLIKALTTQYQELP
jgi:hypothetical protein